MQNTKSCTSQKRKWLRQRKNEFVLKLKFILFFFLYNCIALSQSTKNYIVYHQECRQAEKYFIDSNYNNCFKTYNKVFNSYDFLFPRDCFTAAQLAYKTGEDSLAISYLKRGLPFGLNFDLIREDTSLLISKIIKSKYWNNYTEDYDSLYQLYIKRVDWKLKKELYERVLVDQQWRIKNNKWFNRNFRKRLEEKYKTVNKSHIHFLDSVFKIHGYPGIWLTGVGDSNNIAANNTRNLSEIFFVLLYHYDSAFVQFGEFLYNEIKSGHLHPRVYAMIRDFNDRHLVKKESNQKMYYNIWWEAKNYTEEEFEQHCYEIGCPTKKHLKKLQNAVGNNVDIYWWPFR